MGSRVHGVFLLKTRAMTERSVRSRVFVSPFPSYEKGETWQKNQTNKYSWRKTFSEVQSSCAHCSILVLSGHVILSTKLVPGVGSLPLNWIKSRVRSLPSKKIRFL